MGDEGAPYHHARGIGRHINGSQVYDYWHDPFGFQLEHWTDGDQFNLADGSNRADVKQLLASQWGPTNVLRSAWPGPKGGQHQAVNDRASLFQSYKAELARRPLRTKSITAAVLGCL